MKKKIIVVILIVLLLAAIGYIVYTNIAEAAKPVELQVGWNKFDNIDGIVPKGAIIVASSETNLIIPGERETKKRTGFISGEVVIVYSDTVFTSEGETWIFVPEEYEFILKMDLFSSEIEDKMTDLNGGKAIDMISYYFVGRQ